MSSNHKPAFATVIVHAPGVLDLNPGPGLADLPIGTYELFPAAQSKPSAEHNAEGYTDGDDADLYAWLLREAKERGFARVFDAIVAAKVVPQDTLKNADSEKSTIRLEALYDALADCKQVLEGGCEHAAGAAACCEAIKDSIAVESAARTAAIESNRATLKESK